MKNWMMATTALLLSLTAPAASWPDKKADIDYKQPYGIALPGQKTYCEMNHPSPETDIRKVTANWKNDQLSLRLDMEAAHGAGLNPDQGYQEYYFWIDTNPDVQGNPHRPSKDGYRPYNPEGQKEYSDQVAWSDMYASYRVMLSYDYKESGAPKRLLYIQDCRKENCAPKEAGSFGNDGDLQHSNLSAEEVLVDDGKSVTFNLTSAQIPELAQGFVLSVGATTFYESRTDAKCNGEDDAPDWNHKSFVVGRTLD